MILVSRVPEIAGIGQGQRSFCKYGATKSGSSDETNALLQVSSASLGSKIIPFFQVWYFIRRRIETFGSQDMP